MLLQCCPTVQTSDVHCCFFFCTLTLIDKCLAFYQHLSSIMCTSINDQRSLHGGVETLVVFNHCFCGVATMYFQRVTERDSFQKRDGSRIRERTFHGQRFSTVGWQGIGCPVEDCCADGAMQSRRHGGSRGALARQGERERRCQNLALRATATGGKEGRGGHQGEACQEVTGSVGGQCQWANPCKEAPHLSW